MFITRDNTLLDEVNGYISISWEPNDVREDADFLLKGYRDELIYNISISTPDKYEYKYGESSIDIEWMKDSEKLTINLIQYKFLSKKPITFIMEFNHNKAGFSIYKETPDYLVELTDKDKDKFRYMKNKIKEVLDIVNYLKGNE